MAQICGKRSIAVLGALILLSSLRGFLRDLHTALFRMGRRLDRLPLVYSIDAGPAMSRDANGILQPNTRTLSCMRDIKHFEVDHPEATAFDLEIFRLGWERGTEWAVGSGGKSAPEGKA